MVHSRILILDFGSQFTQLIARRLREMGVYCEIYPCGATVADIRRFAPLGIILSGGPFSVSDRGAPRAAAGSAKPDGGIWSLGIPILGICYGMQYIAQVFGGEVSPAKTREYGRARVSLSGADAASGGPGLFSFKTGQNQATQSFSVWMSHGDEISKVPVGFTVDATTHNGVAAALSCAQKKIYALQYHPEVAHTEFGKEVLKQFAFAICGAQADWSMDSYLDEQIEAIDRTVGPKGRAICALSGGVDSSVAAVLVHRAIGQRLRCVFVDNGLMRLNERKQVIELYGDLLHLNIKVVDGSKRFLSALKGVTDSEKKRKIIGREFIRLFEKEARGAQYLVQGTLYPDVIESVPPPRQIQSGPNGKTGPRKSPRKSPGKSQNKSYSSTIKSHHNVGGLPKNMKMKLVEPLRELFKDEVRALGAKLGLPAEILGRHPFPGPGLAVRVIGAITKERLDVLRQVDHIFIDEIKKSGLYGSIWQAFAVHLPVRSVGVMGDGRTYENVVALRAVTSSDGMTADWYHFDAGFLATVSNRIVNEVRGVNRVVYDISSKPPATIEWE